MHTSILSGFVRRSELREMRARCRDLRPVVHEYVGLFPEDLFWRKGRTLGVVPLGPLALLAGNGIVVPTVSVSAVDYKSKERVACVRT